MNEREHMNAYQRGFDDAKSIYEEPWYLRWAPFAMLVLLLACMIGGCEFSCISMPKADAAPRLGCDTLGVNLAKIEHTRNLLEDARAQWGLDPPGLYLQAFRVIETRPDLQWITFGVYHGDTVLGWPRGRVPTLYAGTTPHPPVMAFAVGAPPAFRQLPLGRLDPGETWHPRSKDGMCSVIFAGYARPESAWKAVRLETP